MPDNCNFDAVPLSQSQEIRTPNLISMNYTNQDFWSMKQRLVQFISEHFEDDFNDFVESSLAIMLIENWAFLADTISFKLDQIVNELFIDTVTEVENAFRLSALVGFEPTAPIAAKANFSATLGSLLDQDMILPTPVRIDIVSNDVPTTFELFPEDDNGNPMLEDDIIIPAGSFSNTAIVGVEGVTRIEQFEASGDMNQSYTLSDYPVIFDSVRVDVDGVRWEEVDYFTDAQPRREYRVEFDSDWRAYVIFGNNRAGAIPPQGSQVIITYRRGGGTNGNVVTGTVNTSLPFEVTGFSISIPVALTNYTRAVNGYNGDTIEEIRRKLPAYIRTQDRAVTGDDYKALADQFTTAYNGQIGKSTAVLRNYGCAGNIVDLFVLARSGDDDLQTASGHLKVELAEHLDEKKMLTDYVCIKDGEVISADVVVELTLDRFFRKFKDEIETRATNQITEFFALTNWDYGDSLREQDVVKELARIREIKRADITFVTNDADNSGELVVAAYYQIIRPDEITLSFTFE